MYQLERRRYYYREMLCTEYSVRKYEDETGDGSPPKGKTLKKGTKEECIKYCKRNHIEPEIAF